MASRRVVKRWCIEKQPRPLLVIDTAGSTDIRTSVIIARCHIAHMAHIDTTWEKRNSWKSSRKICVMRVWTYWEGWRVGGKNCAKAIDVEIIARKTESMMVSGHRTIMMYDTQRSVLRQATSEWLWLCNNITAPLRLGSYLLVHICLSGSVFLTTTCQSLNHITRWTKIIVTTSPLQNLQISSSSHVQNVRVHATFRARFG